MTTDKTSKETQISEQEMKAAARQNAKTAPKADPEVAARALAEAKATKKPLHPAQKLSATLLKDASGDNRHHAKDQIISEFDGPDDS